MKKYIILLSLLSLFSCTPNTENPTPKELTPKITIIPTEESPIDISTAEVLLNAVPKAASITKNDDFKHSLKTNITMQDTGFKASMAIYYNGFFIQMIGGKRDTSNLSEIRFEFVPTKKEPDNTAISKTIIELAQLTTEKNKDFAAQTVTEMLQNNTKNIKNLKKENNIFTETKEINNYFLMLSTTHEKGTTTSVFSMRKKTAIAGN